MRLLLLVATFTLLAVPPLRSAPPQPSPAKPIEFRDTPIADALRQLGRDAKVQLILDESVSGSVTETLLNASPMDALKTLLEAKGLSLRPLEPGSSIYFVMPRAQFLRQLGELDSVALPIAIARYKRRLFDALRHEGFSEQQALAIVAAERTPIADVPILMPQ
jgi:hypothetical protein